MKKFMSMMLVLGMLMSVLGSMAAVNVSAAAWENLAQMEGAVYASSGDEANNPVANAFDGNKGKNSSTRWSPTKVNGVWKDLWLQIDFGKQVTFNQVQVFQFRPRISKMEVQYSDTGLDGSWYSAYTYTNPDADASSTVNVQPAIVCDFSAATARYLRIYINEAVNGPSVFELEVYKQWENLALGKTATVQQGDTAPDGTKLTDGNVSKSVNNFNVDHNVVIDMGQKVYFDRVDTFQLIYNDVPDKRLGKYEILYSNDKQEWMTAAVYDVADADAENHIILEFAPVEARYIKMNIGRLVNSVGKARITEIEVYLTGSQVPGGTVATGNPVFTSESSVLDSFEAIASADSVDVALNTASKDVETPALFLVSFYDAGGKLVDVKSVSDKISKESGKQLQIKAVSVPDGIVGGSVRVFLWDGFDSLKPLSSVGNAPIYSGESANE